MSMADDRLSLPNETDLQSGALLPVNALPHGNGEWNGIAVQDAPSAGEPDLTVYLHAVRRHWLLSLGIGLLCAGIAGPAVYFVIGKQYTAYSVLHLAMQQEKVLPDREARVEDLFLLHGQMKHGWAVYCFADEDLTAGPAIAAQSRPIPDDTTMSSHGVKVSVGPRPDGTAVAWPATLVPRHCRAAMH